MHAIPWRREFTDLFSHPAAKIYKYPAMFVAAINWQRGAQILQNVDHAWTEKMPTNKMSKAKLFFLQTKCPQTKCPQTKCRQSEELNVKRLPR